MKPLSEADYCLIELLIEEELANLKQQKADCDNSDWHALCDNVIERYTTVLKRLWKLSEWDNRC